MIVWGRIIFAIISLGDKILDYVKLQQAKRAGAREQELKSRRAQDEQIDKSRNAWAAGEREFDERLSDDAADSGNR